MRGAYMTWGLCVEYHTSVKEKVGLSAGGGSYRWRNMVYFEFHRNLSYTNIFINDDKHKFVY